MSPLFQHRHTPYSTSTNTELMQALANDSLDRQLVHVFTADIQTAGRGQHGRSWQSPKGNVYLSLYHPIKSAVSGLLSLVVGYHVLQMPLLQSLNQARAKANLPMFGVKWANDLGFYAHVPVEHKQGNNTTGGDWRLQKLAGTLIEPVYQAGNLLGVIVGVGFNVYHPPVLTPKTGEGMNYHPIGLAELFAQTGSDCPLAVSDLYAPLARAICQAIEQFMHMQHQPFLASRFIEGFDTVDILKNHTVLVDNQQTPCRVLGIASDGGLQLADATGSTKTIYTGKIHVISQ